MMACTYSRLGIALTTLTFVVTSSWGCQPNGNDRSDAFEPDGSTDDVVEIIDDSGDSDLTVDSDLGDVIELDGDAGDPDVTLDRDMSEETDSEADLALDSDLVDVEPPRCGASSAIVVNELVASNVSSLLDEEDDSSDWIELYNNSSYPVSLDGWHLSDNADRPYKWAFPNTVLLPHHFLIVFASGKDRSTAVWTWDTRLDWGDDWRYLEVVSPQLPDWKEPDFDDSGWPVGPSGFGMGDDDDATVVDAHTVYVRGNFVLEADELSDLTSLYLHVDYDDGFVAYLNGEDVARRHMIEVEPAWDDPARVLHEARIYQGKAPTEFWLGDAMDLLHEGENVIALEVHNRSTDSSDLTLIPFVTLGYGSEREGAPSPNIELPNTLLHTNFKLSSGGDSVVLTDSDDCEVERFDFGTLGVDQSYGRIWDGTDARRVFLEPTPAAANRTESRLEAADSPVITPPPGFYAEGTSVEIHIESASAELRYTLDGSEPAESDPLYSGPLEIGRNDGVVVVRARAFEVDRWPSRVATATYLADEQEPLAVLSLVTDPSHLWDDETGIYTYGDDFVDSVPYFGANFWKDWERPAHISLWEPDGTLGFAVNAGVQIHGNWSRAFAQRALRFILRPGYGAPSVDYPIFGAEAPDSFERLVLRNSGQDWHGCARWYCAEGAHLRDVLATRLAADAGLDVLAYRPVSVYVNGEYWGIQFLRERLDRRYIESHSRFEDVDLLGRGFSEIFEGDNTHYLAMLDLMRSSDMADDANFAAVQRMMDIENFATYQALEIFIDNGDWPGNNVKLWRPRTVTGRWRWLFFDSDFAFGKYGEPVNNDTLAFALEEDGPDWPNPPWSTELFRLLLENPTFRRDFINRYADYLNTLLSPDMTRAALEEISLSISDEMPRHTERWGVNDEGDGTLQMPVDAWQDEVDGMDSWLLLRTDFARQHIVDNFELTGTYDLALNTSPPGSASFQLTGVVVEPPFDGLYFLDVPVTITVVPNPGTTFVGWSDAELGDQLTVTIDPDGDTSLTAQFE